jgi:CDP-6-deoxy-D-xylo-4-hexulose-3-dehydrase
LVAHLESNKVQTRNYFAGNVLLHPGYSHLDDAHKYPEANQVLNKVFFLGCSPTINQKMIDYIETVVDTFINA